MIKEDVEAIEEVLKPNLNRSQLRYSWLNIKDELKKPQYNQYEAAQLAYHEFCREHGWAVPNDSSFSKWLQLRIK